MHRNPQQTATEIETLILGHPTRPWVGGVPKMSYPAGGVTRVDWFGDGQGSHCYRAIVECPGGASYCLDVTQFLNAPQEHHLFGS